MKKKKQVSSKKKRTKKSKGFNPKFIIVVVVFILSGLMVLRSTYAWLVSEDNRVNEFKGTRLSAEIVEEFEANEIWQPGLQTQKVIQVKNTGNVPAFIRLSLYEFLLTFKIDITDQTGNGNLAVSPHTSAPMVDDSKTTTWSPAAVAGGTYTRDAKHYIAQKAIVPDMTTGDEMYKYKDPLRETTDFKWFNLTFPTNVYNSAPSAGTTNYWLYSKGYFYYSELVQPNELTTPVLQNVTLNKSAPNKFKGALYQLHPVMDAHDATKPLLSTWNIGSSGDVYNLFHDKLAD